MDSCRNERCLAVNKLLYFNADMKHKPDPRVVLTEFIALSDFCSNAIVNDNDRNALRMDRGEGRERTSLSHKNSYTDIMQSRN